MTIAMLMSGWGLYALAGLLVLLAVLLLIAVVWMARSQQKQQNEKTKQEDAAKQQKQEEDEADGKAVRGIAPAFLSAMSRLRHQVSGRDYRYRVPWYLMIGPPDAGKTTLLTESPLRRLLEEDGRGFAGDHSIGWKFYGDGVVLDTAGAWSLGKDANESASWKRLLRLLNRHRPQRPLDGLIVTIACTDLVGEDALDQVALLQRAALLYDRLRQTQQILGFRLPVYFVVTKCDFVPGFRNFCQELPAERLRDMFGWSSPYNLDTAFDPSWVDEAFLELRTTIEQTQNEIFAQRDYTENREEMFLFPGELMALYGPLRAFLARALRSTAYRESLYFRGIYFTGDYRQEEEQPEIQSTLPALPASEPTWPMPETSLIPPIFESWNEPRERIAFVYDLFVKKIFVERGIAHPISNYFYTRNRTTIALQIATALAILILAIGTAYNYLRLQQARGRLLPVLARIDTDLKTSNPAEIAAQVRQATNSSDAGDLLLAMATFQTREFRSIFLPTSWISPIDRSIREAMVPAFRVLVLEHLRDGLEQKAAEITNPENVPLPAIPTQSAAGKMTNFNLQMVPEYQQLQAFVQQIQALEGGIVLYQSIRRRGSSADIATVLRLENYISGRKLSVDFNEEQNAYFEEALRQATWAPFVYRQRDIQHASQKMEQLTNSFFNAWVENNPILQSLKDLSAKLVQLNGGDVTYEQLVALQQAFHTAQTGFGTPDLQWVTGDGLTLTGDMYAVTVAPLQSSQYLQPYLQQWIPYAANQSFNQMADGISDQQSKLTGPLAEVDDGKMVFTDNAEAVEIALDNLLNLPFVAKSNGKLIQGIASQHMRIDWNDALLTSALMLPDAYHHYVDDELQNAPQSLQQVFQRIANQRLAVAMEDQVGQAETIVPENIPHTGISLGNDILPAVQSFEESADTLSQVLNAFQQLNMDDQYDRLSQVATDQAAGLLLELDGAFSSEQPYMVPASAYNSWLGDQPATAAVLGASTPEDVQGYLTVQRNQMNAYGNAAMPLVHFLQYQYAALSPTEQKAFARWQSIENGLKLYADKRPGNSLALLESFVTTGMDKVSPADACAGMPAGVHSSDYFLQVRSTMQFDLYARCRMLNTFNVVRDYAQLAGVFNRELAGRFPFAAPGNGQQAEADPQSIRDFYQLYDVDGRLITAALTQKNNFGTAGVAALMFLEQMQETRSLFSSILTEQKQGSVPAVDFSPRFRVNQTHEVNGNQIIAWTLQVGQNTYQSGVPEQVGRWTYGEPVTLTLRWAKNSPMLPFLSNMKSGVDLSGPSLTYSYSDSWALLKMLEAHRAPITEFTQLADPDPFTLMFQTDESHGGVPAHTDNAKAIAYAKVFLGLTLFSPGKKESLQEMDFPDKAPVIETGKNTLAQAGGSL